MKIIKFNENIDYVEYEDFTESNFIALLFYSSSGYVTNSILFDNEQDLFNYILNYVNNFIKNDIETDDMSDYKYEIDNNGKPYFTSYDEAHNWINMYNADTEPTLQYINCSISKDIKLDNRVDTEIKIKKYNL